MSEVPLFLMSQVPLEEKVSYERGAPLLLPRALDVDRARAELGAAERVDPAEDVALGGNAHQRTVAHDEKVPAGEKGAQ